MTTPQQPPPVAAELAPTRSWSTTIGNAVRSSTTWLFVYLVAGALITGACLWAAGRTGSAQPTHGCRLATDANGFVVPHTTVPAGTGTEPPGIVALQFAGEARAADDIVGRWAACAGTPEEAERQARAALRNDSLLFIPLYVATLAWWGMYGQWSAYRRRTRRMIGRIVVAVVAAGGLDLVENVALRRVVAGSSSPWAAIATAVTVPKWLVLAVAVPLAVAALLNALALLAAKVLRGEAAQPAFYGPIPADEPAILAPLAPEDPEERRRERRFLDPYGAPWPDAKTGICVSGGGIRAASFALGALQALQARPAPDEPSLYESADYLATVSGGGYTATAAQILAHQHPDGPPPLAAGSAEAAVLRDKRRYLWGSPRTGYRWKSTREFVSAVTLFLSGIAFNVAVVVACVYVVSHPLGWFARSSVFAGSGLDTPPPRGLTPGVAVGSLLAAAALFTLVFPYVARAGTPSTWRSLESGVVKVLLGAAALVMVLTADFSPRGWVLVPLGAGAARLLVLLLQRRRSATASEGAHGSWWWAGLAWLILGVVVTTAWYWADSGFNLGTKDRVSGHLAVALAAVAVGLMAGVVAGAFLRIPFDRLRRGRSARMSTAILAAGVLGALVAGVGATAGVLALLRSAAEADMASDRTVWSVVAGALALVYVFGDQKRWSPHPVYKVRLARTFALTRWGPTDEDGGQRAQRLPPRVRTTLSEWAAKPPRGPELLMCAAAYDSMERHPDGLPAWPFVFSHRHVGGSDVGWARTVDFEAVLGRHNQGDGTLQAAMAISGAAVSPAIGRISLGSANALVATANLRLGVWLPSPRVIQAMRAGIPPVPPWIRIRRFSYLLKEIWGGYALDARLVYVTDGGQYDNLGLFELLARRCGTIYCFDASGDVDVGELSTNTFDQARELARQRLGVLFSLPGMEPDGRASGPDGQGQPVVFGALTAGFRTEDPDVDWTLKPCVPVAMQHAIEIEVHYPDGARGRLFFGKCLLTEKQAGTDAQIYASSPAGHSRFPADSTVDQWLDEKQFDAYVDLGRSVGGDVLRLAATPAGGGARLWKTPAQGPALTGRERPSSPPGRPT